ncbi:hypothetical protein ACIQ6R_32235 [Streptomyces sp. NPDC096048]|uniref:hypothetical protein n=1 Tax=Streptomyces sp. NPDC096048 TaxID=3366072 RepID=UPI0037F8DCAD
MIARLGGLDPEAGTGFTNRVDGVTKDVNAVCPPPLGAVPSARGAAVRAVRGSWPLAAGALALAVLGAGALGNLKPGDGAC